MQKSFSIKEAISYGFQRTKANWQVLSILTLLTAGISVILNLLTQLALHQHNGLAYAVIVIISVLVGFYLSAAIIKVSLVEVGGVKALWKDVWSNDAHAYWRFVFTTILIGLLTFAAMIVLIAVFMILYFGALATHSKGLVELVMAIWAIAYVIVGVVISVRLRLATYSALDGSTTAVKAIKESWTITRGNFWKIFGLFVLIGLINILGLIVLFVGVFFTAPLSVIAIAYAFRKLKA